ncbi:hypothetical protein [Paenibacillus sp. FSL M7-1046]|uniref:hypothetical protein n=1 Tax=Paenibacillus sp. FSL M7-1046 TaxID=2975315 RepID=UPI0030FA1C9A
MGCINPYAGLDADQSLNLNQWSVGVVKLPLADYGCINPYAGLDADQSLNPIQQSVGEVKLPPAD